MGVYPHLCPSLEDNKFLTVVVFVLLKGRDIISEKDGGGRNAVQVIL